MSMALLSCNSYFEINHTIVQQFLSYAEVSSQVTGRAASRARMGLRSN